MSCFDHGGILKNKILEILAPKGNRQLENIRANSQLKWRALAQLSRLPEKKKYPLADWSEAVSCLLSCSVHFDTYAQVISSLRPFSQGLK